MTHATTRIECPDAPMGAVPPTPTDAELRAVADCPETREVLAYLVRVVRTGAHGYYRYPGHVDLDIDTSAWDVAHHAHASRCSAAWGEGDEAADPVLYEAEKRSLRALEEEVGLAFWGEVEARLRASIPA
jgi:hypothetical protein